MRALLLVALMACTRDPFAPLPVGDSRVIVKEIPQWRPPALDLLFVIDDSPAMAGFRDDLLANAPRFVNVLATFPGGLPDLHLAVTTAGCAGDGGTLRHAPAVAGAFIVARGFADGTRETNVTGALGDAFTALVDVGASGCATSQPLAAAMRALVDDPGFLRGDAELAIVFIGASDDGSPGSAVDVAAAFKALKRDPQEVMVAGIAGAQACTFDGATAVDAIRLRRFLDQFPNRSTFTTICQADLSDGLQIVVPPFDVVIGDPCFDVTVDPDRCVATDQLDHRDVATLPNCAGQLPCVRFIDDPTNCGATGASAQSVRIDRHELAPLGDVVHIECEIE